MDMEVVRTLGRIEGKLDSLRETILRLRGDHEAVEVRVRLLENWRWYVLGIAMAVATVSSVVVAYIVR